MVEGWGDSGKIMLDKEWINTIRYNQGNRGLDQNLGSEYCIWFSMHGSYLHKEWTVLISVISQVIFKRTDYQTSLGGMVFQCFNETII